MELTPGQRVVAAVAFDGIAPRDAGPAEVVLSLFGTLDPVPDHVRTTLAIVCGRASGKTYVFVALRMLWGALTRDLSTLAPGQAAVAAFVAPDKKTGREPLAYAMGAIESRPELRSMVTTSNADSVTLERPDGQRVRLEVLSASRGGRTTRGRSFTDAALDECAFFRDETTGVVNDVELYKAIVPRLLPGAQMMLPSTPWAESGLLYEFWRANWGKPTTALVVHAPTLAMNPSEANRQRVAEETARDADAAAREFGARFMTGGTTLFFEPASIAACTDETLTLPRTPRPGEQTAAGGDFGFRSDSSALVIVHRAGDLLTVGEIVELRPEDGTPLKPSTTVKAFCARMRAHGATYLMADGHYRETIVEHLTDSNLAYASAPAAPAECYVRARMLLREGRVRLPQNQRLLQQMREVQGKPLPGGGMSIVHPRWRSGGHGDLVAAWVLAVWQLSGDTIAAPKPAEGTAAWEEAARDARRLAAKKKADRPYWMR